MSDIQILNQATDTPTATAQSDVISNAEIAAEIKELQASLEQMLGRVEEFLSH
jgi:hypothetical protein